MQAMTKATKRKIASIMINTNPAINIGAGKFGGVDSPIRQPPITAKMLSIVTQSTIKQNESVFVIYNTHNLL